MRRARLMGALRRVLAGKAMRRARLTAHCAECSSTEALRRARASPSHCAECSLAVWACPCGLDRGISCASCASRARCLLSLPSFCWVLAAFLSGSCRLFVGFLLGSCLLLLCFRCGFVVLCCGSLLRVSALRLRLRRAPVSRSPDVSTFAPRYSPSLVSVSARPPRPCLRAAPSPSRCCGRFASPPLATLRWRLRSAPSRAPIAALGRAVSALRLRRAGASSPALRSSALGAR